MEKTWYMIEYEEKDYLHNKKLEFKKYAGDPIDHAHCELCWERISNYKEDQNVGYYDIDSISWICKSCYNELKELFKWTVK